MTDRALVGMLGAPVRVCDLFEPGREPMGCGIADNGTNGATRVEQPTISSENKLTPEEIAELPEQRNLENIHEILRH